MFEVDEPEGIKVVSRAVVDVKDWWNGLGGVSRGGRIRVIAYSSPKRFAIDQS